MPPRGGASTLDAMNDRSESGIDLYWLPLGAGAPSGSRWVRLNGIAFEALQAALERRPRRDLYHAGLEVRLGDERFIIEVAPSPDDEGARRGVVAEGAVGSRLAAPLRLFRYEVRCWAGGAIPDIAQAVASPIRLTDDPYTARRLLELAPSVPTSVWGRDEAAAGEMWTSNSVISWLISRCGLRADRIPLPPGGRTPGWSSGLAVADAPVRATARKRMMFSGEGQYAQASVEANRSHAWLS
jgi:hypothetical protein